MMTEGYLLVDKPAGMTSFDVVAKLRRRLGIKKIGHGGTLDPFATGLLIILLGREYTKKADLFLCDDKEYLATFHLGIETDTYDKEGNVVASSDITPPEEALQDILSRFQGFIDQIPPMFSAKKIAGKRLYELARQGREVERKPVQVHVQMEILRYKYPEVELHIACSKGTYIRSLAHDIGSALGCYAHVKELRRTRSGKFLIEESTPLSVLLNPEYQIANSIKSII